VIEISTVRDFQLLQPRFGAKGNFGGIIARFHIPVVGNGSMSLVNSGITQRLLSNAESHPHAAARG
jgi:hypothetical protein